MRRLLIILFLIVSYSCNKGAYQVYECWYVVNKTEESLRIIAIDMDKKLLPGDTIPIYGRHRDVDKDFDKLILDFSCFYTRRYGTHKDIILCDSILKEIVTWSIYDENINGYHLMNESAWQKLYEPNNARFSWFYTISPEDLIRLRGY